MKKIISLTLSFLMILSVFAVSGQAFAEDYVSAVDSRSMLKNINSFSFFS